MSRRWRDRTALSFLESRDRARRVSRTTQHPTNSSARRCRAFLAGALRNRPDVVGVQTRPTRIPAGGAPLANRARRGPVVGDRIDVDAAGAAAAGMPCVIIDRSRPVAAYCTALILSFTRKAASCPSTTIATVIERRAGIDLRAYIANRARRPLVQERLHAARRRAGGVLRAKVAAWSSLAPLALAVLATCLVASSNYVLNELLDGPNDRLHPEKRFRPVPSGRVRPALAYAEWLLLAAAGFGLALSLNVYFFASALWLWVMGVALQRAAAAHEGVALPRRAQRIGQQPDPAAARLVRAGHRRVSAGVAGDFVLDGRRVLHGDEALRRVPAHRRTRRSPRPTGARSRTTPRSGCSISLFFYATACALFAGIFIVRYHLELILFAPLCGRPVRVLPAARPAAGQPGAEPREAVPAARASSPT